MTPSALPGAVAAADSHKIPTEEPSDRTLLRQFQGGNQDAAARIYRRYADRLRALVRAKCSDQLARCVEADDIVQSVFGTFFEGASRGYYEIPGGAELWNLFLVIALNRIRSEGTFHHAAKRDVRLKVTGEIGLEADHLADPQEDEAYRFLRLVVGETLEVLPELQQNIIQLRIEGHEVSEIAEQLGRSKRTVERSLQEFRNRLRKVLQKGD